MRTVREVDSEAISRYGYDEDARELYVRFSGSTAYTYHQVPLSAFLALEAADSKGAYVNKVIKPNHDVTKGAPI